MPQGYYTIEQWKPATKNIPSQWVEVFHLPFGESLTAAEHKIEKLGQSGLYRIVHTQRIIWAEEEENHLRLRKSHAASPEKLDDIRQTFERCAGRYPIEEAREARKRAKNRTGST